MRSHFVCLGMALGFLLILPAGAQAGMPSVSLSDWAALRFETISFFLLMLFVAAAVVRWLWNVLAADFPKLPRLTYKKSLAGVILVGLALAVVLTMIAGSRELLTPGAWEKQGRLYKVAAPKETPAEKGLLPETSPDTERKSHLQKLFAALHEHASNHEGKFPGKESVKEIDEALWEVPGAGGMRYLYAENLTTKDLAKILAYEPEFSNGERFVLMTDGKIRAMKTEEIRRELQGEKKP
jgi:hypothetical protein